MGKLFKFIILACLAVSVLSIFYIFRLPEPLPEEAPKYFLPEVAASVEKTAATTSPDGKWVLTMKSEKGKESESFRFLISGPDVSSKEIFTKTLAPGSSLSVPANTFSPDDKYFFLKEVTPLGTGYLVFTTSGGPIRGGSQSLDFAPLFSAKYGNYEITDATGWGGVNLIVFNTDKIGGGPGPSFWFEVPSGAFIQLANRFD